MLVQTTITFGGSAAAQVAPPGTYVTELFIEPVRANTANCFVGASNLTQTGTAGVISDLAKPGGATLTTVNDRYALHAKGGDHNYDASALYVWGTTSDKVNVTYWTV